MNFHDNLILILSTRHIQIKLFHLSSRCRMVNFHRAIGCYLQRMRAKLSTYTVVATKLATRVRRVGCCLGLYRMCVFQVKNFKKSKVNNLLLTK